MKFSQIFTTKEGKNYAATFALVCSLFFLWALCNGMIDTLNKHFQNSFYLTKMQSGVVQFANYIGYFLMALPAGMLARRYGYKAVIILGLALIGIGSFWFIPATHINAYWAFLTGLFVIATGMTCLETVANPYVTVLGSSEMGAARINLAQSFNGLGWIFGPWIGGSIFLSSTTEVNRSNSSLFIPYLVIGIVVVILAIVFHFSSVPDIHAEEEIKNDSHDAAVKGSMWKRKHFVGAVAAQFFYVAAQAGVFSFVINYLLENDSRMPDKVAANWLAFGGFGLFFLGRFTGSFVMRYFKAHSTLALYSMINVVLMLIVIINHGAIGSGAVLLSFLFMSIMFPTIFALGIKGLGEHTKQASSFIVMAIVGGAISPILMGRLADVTHSMHLGFFVPMIGFLMVGLYGLLWQKLDSGDIKSA